MSRKIIVGGVVVAFVIVIGVIGFSGTISIDNISGGTISPTEAPRETMPLEVELEDISIVEVNERAATIKIEFTVTNPNFKSILLQLLKYQLFESGERIRL